VRGAVCDQKAGIEVISTINEDPYCAPEEVEVFVTLNE
jgi:hypothetical protein